MAKEDYILKQTGEQVQKAIDDALALAPATVETPGLMSASDKVKLNGIAQGAKDNVIETVKVNGNALTPENKAVDIPVPDVSQFITKSVNDLENYYLKSETFTRSEVQTLINAVQQFTYESVQTLPEASAQTMHKIYLVPSSDAQAQNIKDEFITIESSGSYVWEQIGSTAIDLSGYVTTSALNTALSDYTTTANLTTLLSGKQDTISDLVTIRSGAAAGATAYQKPASGIPASDMANGVIPEDVVKYASQTLTDSQKTQARTNIGAASEEELDAISRGEYVEAWDGVSEPVVAEIPSGVQVEYNSQTYTGTLAASNDTLGKIYLVATGTSNEYNRYRTSRSGVEGSYTYSWVPFGSTQMNLSGFATKNEISQLQQKVDGLELQPYNLCREVQVGTLIDSNGAEYANNSRCRTGFIEVEPNTDYQIYSLAGVNSYTTPIFEYAADKSFIRKTTWTMTSYNYFTTGSTTKYIRTKSGGDVALSDYRIMVEKGRVRTYFFDLMEIVKISVPYLDKEVGGINKRLQALDGMVSTNASEFEIGDISASGSTITYSSNTKRVRLKKFIMIELAAGSSIWLTNYTNARFSVIQLRDGGTYYTSAWQQDEYIVEEHAFCTLLLSNVPEVAITEVASLAELVRIKDASGKALQIDGLLVDMADVKNRLAAVEGLTDELATESINYEYGKLNATGVDKDSYFAHSEYIEATVGDVIEWKYSNGSVISYGFTVYDAEYNIISTYSGNVNTGIRTITITEPECAYIRASFARDLLSVCYVKKNGNVVYRPHGTSLGLSDQIKSIESQTVIADYSAYSDFLKRGNFYFCQTKLQAGKQYHIDCTGNRTASNPAYIFIRETIGDSATNISDCLAEFSGEFSFSGDYVAEDDCYIGLWLKGGGACSIYQFILYEIGGGEEKETSYKNLDLAMAAKKRLLTSEQQTEAGMTASVHNNNVSSLHQIVHITDMHGDWTRVKRAVAVAGLLDADLVNSGDITLENGTEDISGYESAIAQFVKNYVHCIGNHDSWGLTLASEVVSKFITPFATERDWNVSTDTDATYFYLDDAEKKIRFISVDQWVKYDQVQVGSYYYGQAQMNWFINTLASVPEDYGVIVVIHCPDRQLVMTQDYTKFYQKTRFSGSMGLNGITPISSIIDAWISKTSISETMTSSQEVITINADFSSRTKSEFIAYITGHTHQDGICYLPNTANRQLVLCSTTGNSKYNTTGNELAETSDLARFTEGELQDAFNVYTIDRVAKVVKVVRIGSDMPFDFSERRDCMVIPY